MGRSQRSGQAMRSGRGVVAVGVLLAASALAVGCGSSSKESSGTDTAGAQRTVDSEAVEKGIESSLSTSTVKVTDASCPGDVAVQEGATFTCSVKLSNGGSGKVTVTQKGAHQYAYEFTPGSVKIPGTSAAAVIEKQLAAQGAPNAQVTCPETIIVKVNSPVTCNVSGAQGAAAGTVTFEFSEANGTVSPTSVQT